MLYLVSKHIWIDIPVLFFNSEINTTGLEIESLIKEKVSHNRG